MIKDRRIESKKQNTTITDGMNEMITIHLLTEWEIGSILIKCHASIFCIMYTDYGKHEIFDGFNWVINIPN
jgi:hypothetical protein